MLSNSGLGIARSTNDFALSMQGNWRWLFYLFIQHSTVIIISMTAAKVTCSLWEHFDINNFKRGEICLILCMYVRRKGIYSTGSVGVSIKWFCFHDTQESHFEKKSYSHYLYWATLCQSFFMICFHSYFYYRNKRRLDMKY